MQGLVAEGGEHLDGPGHLGQGRLQRGPDRLVLGVLGGGTGEQVAELAMGVTEFGGEPVSRLLVVRRHRQRRRALPDRVGHQLRRPVVPVRHAQRQPRPGAQGADEAVDVAEAAPQRARARVGLVGLGEEPRVAEGLGGEMGERGVVVLLGPVPGGLGRLQPAFRRGAVFAELAQAVAEPPLRLDDQALAVRLGAQVGQRRLQHLGGLREPPLPQQEPAELVPRPGAQRAALARLVGPVRRLEGVFGGLLGQPPAAEHLRQLQMQLGPPRGLQMRSAVLQGRPQRPLRLRGVAEVVREPGQPGLVLHREPRQTRPDERRRGPREQLRGPLHVPGERRQLREHRLRLRGPGGQPHIVPGPPVDEREHLTGGGLGVGEDGLVHRVLGLVHPAHQNPRPAHQHGRRLPDLRAVLGVQREHPVVQVGDRREGLGDLARESAYVGSTRACRQGLPGVARLRVQLGGLLEQGDALGAQVHRPVVGDLRPVAGGQLDALGGPRHRRPGLDGVRLQGVRQPPRLGEQRGQIGLRVLGHAGRGRRGRRRGRRPHRRTRPQRQPLHQWPLCHTRACPLADVRRAVALVEARGQREGLPARVGGEFASGPVAAHRARHLLITQPERAQAVHEQGHHRHEVQLAARMPVVREVRRPLREQLQAARLVPGQRAELHVVRVRPAHALHGPHEPESPQMVGAGLVLAAQAQQRHQGGREDRVRLVGACELALKDRPPQPQRRHVPAPLRLPPPLPVQLAGVAVGHAVPVGGQPGGVRPLGPRHVPDMRGHAELGAANGPFGVPGEPVAALHLAEPLLDRGQRDVRLVEHAGRHPLEDPVQRVRLVLVEVLGPLVPHAQQTREGDEHLRLLRAVVVDLQLVSERLDHGERDVQLLGLGEQPLRARVAGGTLRLLAVLLHRPAQ
ncbi:hypothetical protein STVIR_2257 [Streptomyces viridochromogenes Tue57]|uniref:Uncharacterized protein n=1 Tax=Streptomyces viridochromogenes Tue57 TaxID=1160705 RepID=L8PKM1_STRVR|nr:hypothetical protein STVIR_2257 [Streptomyces viridochromogenes Tue57]